MRETFSVFWHEVLASLKNKESTAELVKTLKVE